MDKKDIEKELNKLAIQATEIRNKKNAIENEYCEKLNSVEIKLQDINQKIKDLKRSMFENRKQFLSENIGKSWVKTEEYDYHSTPYTTYTILPNLAIKMEQVRVDDEDSYLITKIIEKHNKQKTISFLMENEPVNDSEYNEVKDKMFKILLNNS